MARNVHSVCMWDEKEGPAHIYTSLKKDILDFIKQAQSVSHGFLNFLVVGHSILVERYVLSQHNHNICLHFTAVFVLKH